MSKRKDQCGCDGFAEGNNPNLLPTKKRILLSWKHAMDEEGIFRRKKKRKIQEESSLKKHEEILPLKKRPSLRRACLPMDDEPIIPQEPREERNPIPVELKRKIEEMGGGEIKMVIQKKLFESDLTSSKNRFSIPENKIAKEAMHFLKQQEKELLGQREKSNKLAGIPVLVIDPRLKQFNLILKKWPMTRSSVYNLIRHWNIIVQCNNLRLNDTVQLWSFRISDKLCFALVKL